MNYKYLQFRIITFCSSSIYILPLASQNQTVFKNTNIICLKHIHFTESNFSKSTTTPLFKFASFLSYNYMNYSTL